MTNDLDSFIGAYQKNFAYDFDNEIMLNWYPERIIASCNNTDRVLELGVGHGHSTKKFSEFFAELTVVDGSPSVIEQFASAHPHCNAKIVESYFEAFETDHRFDVIVMGFVLEHVDDPIAILRRYRKLLTPSGRCFVAVPNAENLNRRFGHAAGMLHDIMALNDGDIALGHQRLYTVKTLNEAFELAGYEVVRREGIFLKPLPTAKLKLLNFEPAVLRAMCVVGIDYPELSSSLLFEAKVA
jgi:trans-aconitate methyltransferase